MGVYLSLGSNIGDCFQNLNHAWNAFRVIQKSSIYETEPVGYLEQPWFLNLVIQIETEHSPIDLLMYCQSIEIKLGRQKKILKGPRTIDIDILFYNELILKNPDLTVPHPEIPNRRFVLEPLNEIAPLLRHPESGKTIAELLALCPDRSVVQKIDS